MQKIEPSFSVHLESLRLAIPRVPKDAILKVAHKAVTMWQEFTCLLKTNQPQIKKINDEFYGEAMTIINFTKLPGRLGFE